MTAPARMVLGSSAAIFSLCLANIIALEAVGLMSSGGLQAMSQDNA